MPTGSRWRVLLTSTESTYSNSREPARIAVEAGADLTVPVVDATPVGTSIAGTDTESALARRHARPLLVVLAGVAALWRRRQRRHEEPRPDLADVPLVVEDLVKTYADGHRAVDDVSWRAEKGQVVGLLGPNGAGKTTTMRMVMGLIASDAGSVHVLGEPVSAGSDVLGRVGALIEGPGFLPHLTGRQNLEAYWAATGRRPEDAHIDEALEVAALGGAVDRPVQVLQPRHEAAARHRPGDARAARSCSSSTSRPTASTRRRSRRCARSCAATPRPVAPSSSRATCSPRSR